MIYVKSFLAGIAAVVLVVPTVTISVVIALVAFYRPPHGSAGNAVSWDSRSLIGTWPFTWTFWITITFIFALGFVWEFRRASRAR
jgi:hypothetical protein